MKQRLLVPFGLLIASAAYAQQPVRVTNGAATAADNSMNSTTKAPVIGCVANAAAPSWTETNQVPCSVDLSGGMRFNLMKLGTAAVDTNSGNKSAGTLRVVFATDQPAFSTPMPVAPTALVAGAALIGEVTPMATATTTDSALGCYLVSAASTNSTNCKASAGNFYGVRIVNTTATLYYLRMYNLASAPTCSSATGFVESIPIPASTSGAGIVAIQPIPIGYTTGISYCFTAGSSSSDNTSAATGVFGALLVK